MFMMQWLSNNWAFVAFGVITIIYVITNPSRIQEWLVWACGEAEKELGNGTGQIKLRQVYHMFLGQYPIFSKFVPFSIFEDWVSNALKVLKNQMENNKNVKEYIETKTETIIVKTEPSPTK